MKLVTIYTSISINEVNYVKSMLEANDIKATILDDAVASLAPHHLFGQGGARLAVLEADVELAKEFITEYEKDKKERSDTDT